VFVAAVILVDVLGRGSALGEWGAGLYFSARLVYLLLYAAGIPLLRSLVWNVAFSPSFAGVSLARVVAPTRYQRRCPDRREQIERDSGFDGCGRLAPLRFATISRSPETS
jgi:hypothetical protein